MKYRIYLQWCCFFVLIIYCITLAYLIAGDPYTVETIDLCVRFSNHVLELDLEEKQELFRIYITLGYTSKIKCWQLQHFAKVCKPWQQHAYQTCLRFGNL